MRSKSRSRWLVSSAGALAVLGALALGGGCGGEAGTGVLLIIDAEGSARARIERLQVAISGGAVGDERFAPLPVVELEAPGEDGWPLKGRIRPKGGVASRRFLVVVRAFEADAQVAVVGVEGGFEPGRWSELRLVLEEACLDVSCPEGEVCAGGSCRALPSSPGDGGGGDGGVDGALPACVRDEDCPDPSPSPWGACMAAGDLGDDFCQGVRRREVTRFVCNVAAGACEPRVEWEEEPCQANEGEPCGDEVCDGTWGPCVYDDACAESGRQVRTCRQPVCSGGSCVDRDFDEERACTRSTDGQPCACGVCMGGACQVRWSQVSAGAGHTCALDVQGGLWCWGEDDSGQLGLGRAEGLGAVTEPQRVEVVGVGAWAKVSAGWGITCAISGSPSSTGPTYCWGDNRLGHLDRLGDEPRLSRPKQWALNSWIEVATGGSGDVSGTHVCAVRNDGTLWCAGENDSGQLGLGDTMDRRSVTQVSSLSNMWSAVSAGAAHTCGIRGGQLYCWGANGAGQLGRGDTNPRDVPEGVGVADWSAVSAGSNHTCGIRGGALYCWGAHNFGQLGLGSGVSVANTPQRVGSASDWSAVSAGSDHTCGIRGGALYCWGMNDQGQLGLGDTNRRNTPQRVGSASDWSAVSAGVFHTCAVDMGGRLHCWGLNTEGILGTGGSAGPVTRPAEVVATCPPGPDGA